MIYAQYEHSHCTQNHIFSLQKCRNHTKMKGKAILRIVVAPNNVVQLSSSEVCAIIKHRITIRIVALWRTFFFAAATVVFAKDDDHMAYKPHTYH